MRQSTELLAPTAETVLDDMTYVWGDKEFGLIEKANAVELEGLKYNLSYFKEDGSSDGSDITGAAGFCGLDKLTVALETVVALKGAVTFGDFADNFALPLNKAINTEGSVLIGSSKHHHSVYDYEMIKYEDNGSLYLNKYAISYITSSNARHLIVFQNTPELSIPQR